MLVYRPVVVKGLITLVSLRSRKFWTNYVRYFFDPAKNNNSSVRFASIFPSSGKVGFFPFDTENTPIIEVSFRFVSISLPLLVRYPDPDPNPSMRLLQKSESVEFMKMPVEAIRVLIKAVRVPIVIVGEPKEVARVYNTFTAQQHSHSREKVQLSQLSACRLQRP